MHFTINRTKHHNNNNRQWWPPHSHPSPSSRQSRLPISTFWRSKRANVCVPMTYICICICVAACLTPFSPDSLTAIGMRSPIVFFFCISRAQRCGTAVWTTFLFLPLGVFVCFVLCMYMFSCLGESSLVCVPQPWLPQRYIFSRVIYRASERLPYFFMPTLFENVN